MSRGAPPIIVPGMSPADAAPDEPHRRKPRRKAVRSRVSELSLTSFMDLVFNLLMFFVLTASFTIGEGVLPADLPQGTGVGSQADEPPEMPITIALRSFGMGQTQIQVSNQAMTSFEQLYQWLRERKIGPTNPGGLYKEDNRILIQPERNVPWRDVVDAFNAVIRAQYTNIGFAQAEER